jgi:predicted NBD/HSP70 family sugar kinase
MGYFCNYLRRNQDNMVYLYIGNGIGSGIILNRQLYRGSINFSGEIGFMVEPESMIERNYVAEGGFMESIMRPLVDYNTGELKPGNKTKQRKELATILGAIAVNHVVLLNPGVVVFAGKIFDKDLIETVKRRMANYLPAEIMPRITLDSSSTTGLEGLVQSCRGYITTGIHLVQSTGLRQRADRIVG